MMIAPVPEAVSVTAPASVSPLAFSTILPALRKVSALLWFTRASVPIVIPPVFVAIPTVTTPVVVTLLSSALVRLNCLLASSTPMVSVSSPGRRVTAAAPAFSVPCRSTSAALIVAAPLVTEAPAACVYTPVPLRSLSAVAVYPPVVATEPVPESVIPLGAVRVISPEPELSALFTVRVPFTAPPAVKVTVPDPAAVIAPLVVIGAFVVVRAMFRLPVVARGPLVVIAPVPEAVSVTAPASVSPLAFNTILPALRKVSGLAWFTRASVPIVIPPVFVAIPTVTTPVVVTLLSSALVRLNCLLASSTPIVSVSSPGRRVTAAAPAFSVPCRSTSAAMIVAAPLETVDPAACVYTPVPLRSLSAVAVYPPVVATEPVPERVIPLGAVRVIRPEPELMALFTVTLPFTAPPAVRLTVPDPAAVIAPLVVIGAFVVVKPMFRLPVVARGPLVVIAPVPEAVSVTAPASVSPLAFNTILPALRKVSGLAWFTRASVPIVIPPVFVAIPTVTTPVVVTLLSSALVRLNCLLASSTPIVSVSSPGRSVTAAAPAFSVPCRSTSAAMIVAAPLVTEAPAACVYTPVPLRSLSAVAVYPPVVATEPVPESVIPLGAVKVISPEPELSALFTVRVPFTAPPAVKVTVPDPAAVIAPLVVIGAFVVVRAMFRLPVVARGPLVVIAPVPEAVSVTAPASVSPLAFNTILPALRKVSALLWFTRASVPMVIPPVFVAIPTVTTPVVVTLLSSALVRLNCLLASSTPIVSVSSPGRSVTAAAPAFSVPCRSTSAAMIVAAPLETVDPAACVYTPVPLRSLSAVAVYPPVVATEPVPERVIPLGAVRVIRPEPELSALFTVRVPFTAPPAVRLTVPDPAAVMGPLVVIAPVPEAVSVTAPASVSPLAFNTILPALRKVSALLWFTRASVPIVIPPVFVAIPTVTTPVVVTLLSSALVRLNCLLASSTPIVSVSSPGRSVTAAAPAFSVPCRSTSAAMIVAAPLETVDPAACVYTPVPLRSLSAVAVYPPVVATEPVPERVIPLGAVRVIRPEPELSALFTVRVPFTAPPAVRLTVPDPAAVMGPLVVIAPVPEAVSVTAPASVSPLAFNTILPALRKVSALLWFTRASVPIVIPPVFVAIPTVTTPVVVTLLSSALVRLNCLLASSTPIVSVSSPGRSVTAAAPAFSVPCRSTSAAMIVAAPLVTEAPAACVYTPVPLRSLSAVAVYPPVVATEPVPESVIPLGAVRVISPEPELSALFTVRVPFTAPPAVRVTVPDPAAVIAPLVVIGAFVVVRAMFRLPVVARGPLVVIAPVPEAVSVTAPASVSPLAFSTILPALRKVSALLWFTRASVPMVIPPVFVAIPTVTTPVVVTLLSSALVRLNCLLASSTPIVSVSSPGRSVTAAAPAFSVPCRSTSAAMIVVAPLVTEAPAACVYTPVPLRSLSAVAVYPPVVATEPVPERVIPLGAVRVIRPEPELSALFTVRVPFTAPPAVRLTVPDPAAVMGPLVVIAPVPEAVSVTAPASVSPLAFNTILPALRKVSALLWFTRASVPIVIPPVFVAIPTVTTPVVVTLLSSALVRLNCLLASSTPIVSVSSPGRSVTAAAPAF